MHKYKPLRKYSGTIKDASEVCSSKWGIKQQIRSGMSGLKSPSMALNCPADKYKHILYYIIDSDSIKLHYQNDNAITIGV